jgi:hypothetical protein
MTRTSGSAAKARVRARSARCRLITSSTSAVAACINLGFPVFVAIDFPVSAIKRAASAVFPLDDENFVRASAARAPPASKTPPLPFLSNDLPPVMTTKTHPNNPPLESTLPRFGFLEIQSIAING